MKMMKNVFCALLMTLSAWCAALAPEAETFIWRISKDHTPTSYLIGTVHVGKQGNTLPTAYRQALAQTPRLVVETQIDEAFFQSKAGMERAMLMMNMAQSPHTLRESLGEKRNARFQQVLRRHVADAGIRAMFQPEQRWQPWFVKMSLDFAILPKGYNEKYGIDALLIKAARVQNKEVTELEGVEAMKIFQDLPEDAVLRAIDVVLKRPQNQVAEAQNLLKLYETGQVSALWRQMEDEKQYLPYPPADRALWRTFGNDVLLVRRNRQWLPKLTAMLDKQANTVAVGAAHLFGEQGLIKLLREKGYRVEPVLPAKH
ncbi:TraB/GumN family protein [Conchiformibius kuhniae]|uniref:TraB/GumN family protein n=1 Tax=Conchiformibius kuhniae TaxID=211502 RepID=A0A8T9MVE5_9NEIS|nr:TraB/GumN family protein [Conchiformibius kuhniae]UOP04102.1 TraB/GumN family protein [Conchiformibius kuhniae]